MTKRSQSKSARIRKMLDQGKSVKQITALLHCHPQQVYQVRSDMKKAKQKAFQIDMMNKANTALAAHAQQEALNIMAAKPGAVRYGDIVMVPKDYVAQKPSLWQRVKQFLGA